MLFRSFLRPAIPALAVLLTGNAVAADAFGPQVYGRFVLGYENVDDKSFTEDFWQLRSYASRFGVKGELNTDVENISAFYIFEWQVDATDRSSTNHTTTTNNHLTSRNQAAGLKTPYGELLAGRYDTALKQSQGAVDQFNDYEGDITVLTSSGEVRANNLVQYASPKIAERIVIKAQVITGEQTLAPTAPAADLENGPSDASSVSVEYSDANLYVAVAHDSDVANLAGGVTIVIPGFPTFAPVDTSADRFTVQWKNDSFGIGALTQTTDLETGEDEEISVASAYFKSGKLVFKAQAGSTDNYNGIPGAEADLAAFGVDFNLSKKSIVGVHITQREGGDNLLVIDPDTLAITNVERDVFGFTYTLTF